MTWAEFRYIRLGQPIPLGWELVADFNDCHHGRYSQGIIKKIENPEPDRCPHCGNPLIEDWDGAHYNCTVCKQITTSCCCGASEGEAG